ncbi:SDR family oxidoreductase [Candidatus Parcubacteria bacterium]|nr:MAG: SDR family oxidoreductase [Candidatus Parcubacteria bacterium]
MRKRALVTGGAGFIGSHLVERLLEAGHQVTVLDNLSTGRLSNLESCKGALESGQLTFHRVDIRDYAVIAPLFEDQDWVFHLAALADIVPSIEMPEAYYTTNVDGTFNVLQASRNAGVKRFVYAASSSCYGIPDIYPTPEEAPIRPQYPYALTKRLGEELVLHWAQVYKLPANSLRLFNVYGPRVRTTGTYGAVFGVFLAQKLHGKPFTVVGDGTQSRDFTYVTDVAEAFYMTAEADFVSEVMNVGSGGHYTINRLVELLGGEVEYIPKRPGEPDITFADTRHIRELLGWNPKISFEEGVAEMIRNIEMWRDAPVWDRDSIHQATRDWFKYLGQAAVDKHYQERAN